MHQTSRIGVPKILNVPTAFSGAIKRSAMPTERSTCYLGSHRVSKLRSRRSGTARLSIQNAVAALANSLTHDRNGCWNRRRERESGHPRTTYLHASLTHA
jgi:hypothetical protein